MFKIFGVLLWISACELTFGKVFQPLELSQELEDLGVPDWDIPLLVCHAHHVSDLRTDFNKTDEDPNKNAFGIFGLNFRRMDVSNWHHCWMPVAKLMDDDISDDVKCLLDFLSPSRYDPLGSSERTDASRGHAIFKLLDLHGPDFFSVCIDWWTGLPSHVYNENKPCPDRLNDVVIIASICFVFNMVLFYCSVWVYAGSRAKGLRRTNDHISFTNLQTLENTASVHM